MARVRVRARVRIRVTVRVNVSCAVPPFQKHFVGIAAVGIAACSLPNLSLTLILTNLTIAMHR